MYIYTRVILYVHDRIFIIFNDEPTNVPVFCCLAYER